VAESLSQRALAVFEVCLASIHLKVLTCRQTYPQLVQDSQRCAEDLMAWCGLVPAPRVPPPEVSDRLPGGGTHRVR
jgi:hypothetical protein